MTSPSASCLSDASIARWLAGQAVGTELEQWDAHLGNCPSCLKRLAEARAQDAVADSDSAELVDLLADAAWIALAAGDGNLPGVLPPNADPAPTGDASGLVQRFGATRFIAEGGMGAVYLGQDRQTGRTVAIKRLRPDLDPTDFEAIERFEREGEILAQLDHPNIVKMIALLPGPPPAIVMELVEGGSLRRLLQSQPVLPLEQSLRLLLEITDALSRAHHLGVIHRDIKPENVLLTKQGTPRLSDFGMARMGARHLTAPGMMLGTIPYLSPELLDGQEADERSDLWALGVMSFEMLTGARPFQGRDVTTMLAAILEQPLPDLAELRPDGPGELVDLLYRLLEKDPRQRPNSARQVGAELEAISRALPAQRTGQAEAAAADARRMQSTMSPRPRHGAFGRRHNLPVETTAFVGREVELARLSALLADPAVRLSSVVGPGGVGKSRLALEASRKLLAAPGARLARGVFLVDLTPLRSAEWVASALAEALGFAFRASPEESVQLLDYLRDKQMLLLLDNFEHVLPAAELVHRLLLGAVNVKVLVTSREPLGLSAEVLLPLSGLNLPDPAEPAALERASAAQLFLETARRVQPGLDLGGERARDIVRICHSVQGMPLGIVLAASLSRMLSTSEIADEVEHSLDFLQTDRIDLPLRQHSLRALFEHSWRLLNPAERSVLASVSIFRGGFTRAAATAVAGARLSSLAALLNKSLLNRNPDDGRYDVHELVRQFAEAKLVEDADLHARTLDQYVDYYAGFLATRRADWSVADRRRTLQELQTERGNLRWSWQLMLRERRLDAVDRAIDALLVFHEARSSRSEAEAQFAAIIERFGPATTASDRVLRRVVGVASSACAVCCEDQGRGAQAARLLNVALELLDATVHPRERAFALVHCAATQVEESLDRRVEWAESGIQLYRAVGDRGGLGWALYRLGMIYYSGNGGLSKAVACLRESIDMQQSSHHQALVRPLTLARLGSFLYRQGDVLEGSQLSVRAVQLARELGDDGGLDACLQILAMIQCDLGDLPSAEAAAREGLARKSEYGRRVTWCLITLADIATDGGRLDEAEALYRGCLSRYPEDALAANTARHGLGDVALLRGQLDEARRWTEQSVAGFERMSVGWGSVRALDTLGEVARLEHDYASARQCFSRACQVGLAAEVNDVLASVAAGIALLYADTGRTAEALELLHVLEAQPTISARLHARRLEPLRALLGIGPNATTAASGKHASDLRAALERCMRQRAG